MRYGKGTRNPRSILLQSGMKVLTQNEHARTASAEAPLVIVQRFTVPFEYPVVFTDRVFAPETGSSPTCSGDSSQSAFIASSW